jgi:D-alanyl-D-alanine endopeptidase (penicillin-binding protein 7)
MGQHSRRVLTGIDYDFSGRRPRRFGHFPQLAGVIGLTTALLVWAYDGGDTPAAPATQTASAQQPQADPMPAATTAVANVSAPAQAPAAKSTSTAATAPTELASIEPVVPTTASTTAIEPAAEAAPESVPAKIAAPKPVEKLPRGLSLKSSVVLVVDQKNSDVLAARRADRQQPIASLTKLMTALVVLEAGLPMDDVVTITRDDYDALKHTYSRLVSGDKFTREQLLLLALMSSENRAAAALARSYPGGTKAFVATMNAKAAKLGMADTHFVDASGLSQRNVSTAHDLVKLIKAAYAKPTIRKFSTQVEQTVKPGKRKLHYVNSNRLVRYRSKDWRIGLQKTGYTNEAGRCLVMQTQIDGRPVIMVLLDSYGSLTRFADAKRVRSWIERTHPTAHASKASDTASS